MKFLVLFLVFVMVITFVEGSISISMETVFDEQGIIIKMNPNGSGVSTIFIFERMPGFDDRNIEYLQISSLGGFIAFNSNRDRYYNLTPKNIFVIDSVNNKKLNL